MKTFTFTAVTALCYLGAIHRATALPQADQFRELNARQAGPPPPAPTRCTSSENRAVRLAINNAKLLAKSARDQPTDGLWKTFFNGNPETKNGVFLIFDAIANFNIVRDKTRFRCDTASRTNFCKFAGQPKAVGARATPFTNARTGETNSQITLCGPFFGINPARYCTMPTRLDRGTDQGGVLLHEMTHLTTIVGEGAKTGDGPRNSCYSLRSIEGAARDKGDNPCGEPKNIASAYELYAYASRAFTNATCKKRGRRDARHGVLDLDLDDDEDPALSKRQAGTLGTPSFDPSQPVPNRIVTPVRDTPAPTPQMSLIASGQLLPPAGQPLTLAQAPPQAQSSDPPEDTPTDAELDTPLEDGSTAPELADPPTGDFPSLTVNLEGSGDGPAEGELTSA